MIENKKSKIIFLDFGIFMFRPIKSYSAQVRAKMEKIDQIEQELKQTSNFQRQTILRKQLEETKDRFVLPPEWTSLNMIQSCLKHVGLNKEDTVIIACDYGHSWRKDYDQNYKANRKALREKDPYVDWNKMFKRFNILRDKIDEHTPFRVIKVHRFEADDIIAYGTEYYNDRICVIVSSDSDYEQLCARPNVRIFSPISKKYKLIKNPYLLIAKKVKKEASDNLLTPVLSEEDYKTRMLLVNLLELPEFVTSTLKPYYDELLLDNKEFHYDKIPYQSMQKRFKEIYDKNKEVDYDKCIEKIVKKEQRQRKKKIKEKKNQTKKGANNGKENS
ncbi:MAG: hypothetical protein ACTSPD_10115 [Promethearchaeota archaeon]